MRIRYLRNTAGDFVAFAQGDNLFTPQGDWLGVIRGADVFDTAGERVGALWPDGRLVRNRSGGLSRSILQPRQPLRPVRPLPARRGLFLPEITPPNEDVFQGLIRPLTALTPLATLHRLFAYQGAALVAGDGEFLGVISRDRSEPDSLSNVSGPFGNPFSETSIFNPQGVYGRTDSDLSPFTATSQSPVRIEADGEFMRYLSANRDIQNRVDPNALVAWLAMR